jgi:hypothetical protein
MDKDVTAIRRNGWTRRAFRAPRILGGLAMITLAGSNLYWMRSTLFGRAPSRAVLQWLSTVSGGFLNEATMALGSCLLLGMGIVLLVIGIARLILIEDRRPGTK